MSTKLNKLCPQSLPRIDNKANNDGYVTKRAKMSLKHFQSFPNSIRDYPNVTRCLDYLFNIQPFTAIFFFHESREDIVKQGQYVAKYYLKRPTKIATVFINVAKVVKFCKILVTLEHTLVKPMLV